MTGRTKESVWASFPGRISSNKHSPQAVVDSIDKKEVASFCAVKFTTKKKLSTPQEVLNFNKVWRPLADTLRTFSFE